MGNKVEAKALMRAAGVPILLDSSTADYREIGVPLLVKAAAGGGGRGMRVVRTLDELDDARAAAEREAAAAFGDGTVFYERYVERGRHVEIQVLADAHGHGDLAPRTGVLDPATPPEDHRGVALPRRRRGAARGGWPTPRSPRRKPSGYVGAGTVEFLLEPDGRFWFLEMNTRLQVEHPVTELVTGLDLVELQLAVADGAPLPAQALDAPLNGHAIEARLTAEDPAANYRPSTGRFTTFEVGDDVRVDTGVATGSIVPPYYDSMVAKVIAHGPTRDAAIRTLAAALSSARLHGPTTNRDQLVRVLRHAAFRAGDLHTGFLDEHPCTEPITGRSADRRRSRGARRPGRTPRVGRTSGATSRPAGATTRRSTRPSACSTASSESIVSYRLGRGRIRRQSMVSVWMWRSWTPRRTRSSSRSTASGTASP